MLLEDYISKLKELMALIKREFIEELKDQGHINNGSLANSMSYEVNIVAGSIIAEMYALDYAIILDTGVKPSRIPYRRGSGAGTSNYIKGLIDYFRSKGFGEDEAKGFSFATANVQKREGMPTRNSFEYSSNGRRTGFIDATLDSINLEERVNSVIEGTLEATFYKMFDDKLKAA